MKTTDKKPQVVSCKRQEAVDYWFKQRHEIVLLLMLFLAILLGA